MATEVDKLIGKAATKYVKAFRDELEKKKAVASRNLQASIHTSRIFNTGKEIGFEISMAEYWGAVEHGRKPGKMPPIAPIMDWIMRKGIPLKGKGLKKNQAKSMAFGIAKNIAKKGTIKRFGYKGSNFIKDASSKETPNFIKSLTEAMGKDIKFDITTK